MRNLPNIICVSNQHNDDRLLNLIYDKYTEIFDKEFLAKHTLPNDFTNKCLKRVIHDEIKNNNEIIYHDLSRKFVFFYQTVYEVLFEKFDDEFIKNYINHMTFPKFSYNIIKPTQNAIQNYLKVFDLLNLSDTDLNKYVVQACYDLHDKEKRKDFRNAILNKYERYFNIENTNPNETDDR